MNSDPLAAAVDAFLRRAYPDCLRACLAAWEESQPPAAAHLAVISGLRTGAGHLLPQLLQFMVPDLDEWNRVLLALTLDQIDPSEAIIRAVELEQSCQWTYYAAAKVLTDGDVERAREMFATVATHPADCLERRLAAAELAPKIQTLDYAVVVGRGYRETAGLIQHGRFAEAREAGERAVELARRHLPPRHEDRSTALNNLGEAYRRLGDLTAAEAHLREALEAVPVTDDADDMRRASGLDNLATVLLQTERLDEAEAVLQQTSETFRRVEGEQSPALARSLNKLADLYRRRGDHAAAQALLPRVIAIRRAALGDGDPAVATALMNLAESFRESKRYAEAEPLYREAAEIDRAALGESHPEYAVDLHNLAAFLVETDRASESVVLFRQALAVRRATYGDRSLEVAATLTGLTAAALARGDRPAAERDFGEALAIHRAALGPAHRRTIALFDWVADLQKTLGNWDGEEWALRQAVAVLRPLTDRAAEFVVRVLPLAEAYARAGDYDSAEILLKEAFHLPEEARLGDRAKAAVLNGLANVYCARGQYLDAAAHLRTALRLLDNGDGERDPMYQAILHNLALTELHTGGHVEAEAMLRKTIDARRSAGEIDRQELAAAVNNLGGVYLFRGEFAAAEPHLRESLALRREEYGTGHPRLYPALTDLARAAAALGRPAEALALLEEAIAGTERHLGSVFAGTAERQRMDFLQATHAERGMLLTLVSESFASDVSAVRAAYTLVLRRKAIVAEAGRLLRADPASLTPAARDRLERLNALRARTAARTLQIWRDQRHMLGQVRDMSRWMRAMFRDLFASRFDGVALPIVELAEAAEEQERLEVELARDLPEIAGRQTLTTATPEQVAARLPEGSALVEFVHFHRFNPRAVETREEKQWAECRYLAFVLPAGAPAALRLIDLGDATTIREHAAAFRHAVGRAPDERARDMTAVEAPADAAGTGERLREIAFDPLLAALGDRTRLIIAPDADLACVPFEVLPTADGLLGDRYRISYATCGRDLLRRDAGPTGDATAPLVVADPTFDMVAAPACPAVTPGGYRRSRDFFLHPEWIEPLPATRAEGGQVAALLGAPCLLGADALKGRVRRCRSPRVLHLATHGFFLEDQPDAGPARAQPENPLLRSGLLLAGVVNFLRGHPAHADAEDGLLTAEDVTGMDLVGTELVVLSACQTGLGEVTDGEGVFGLRRAFVLAGARSLVMSLWAVPDEQTQQLMSDFYQRLLAGESRLDALRGAQHAVRTRYPAPYYWGAFILQGETGPLPA